LPAIPDIIFNSAEAAVERSESFTRELPFSSSVSTFYFTATAAAFFFFGYGGEF
jgi:hypothetical protein